MALTKLPAGTKETTTTTVTLTTTVTFGSRFDDYILGTIVDDIISGGDTPVAYTADGSDSMEGGLGDDQYIVNDTTDIITEYSGEGIDSVFTSVPYILGTELENIIATGTTAVTLTGNDKDNILDGSQGTGTDTLIGGAGNDTYILGSSDVVNVDTSGLDTVVANFTIDLSLTSATPNFAENATTAIENVILGPGNFNIIGNALNNRLTGGSGNNTLLGGLGNDILDSGSGGTDSLDGGAGNDIYIIRNASTTIASDLSGIDTLKTFYKGITSILDITVENVTQMGSLGTNIIGNVLDNILIGNNGKNLITGGDGNDTLTGGRNVDTLQGESGSDLYIADASDLITESSSNDDVDSVQLGGIDTTTVFVLNDNVETLTMTGTLALKASASTSSTPHTIVGNSGSNTITGGTGNDILNGDAGADSLNGGAGNDTYFFDNTGDIVAEIANAGTDSVTITAAGGLFTVGPNIEIITLAGTTNCDVTTSSLIFTMNGNSGSNQLKCTGASGVGTFFGNDGDDIITGSKGDDILNGGTGADSMVGGAGKDKYYIDNIKDKIEDVSGIDDVESTISYTLPTNVENLTLMMTALVGTGNASDNIIIGNDSANTLNGGAGADTITGGKGIDTYIYSTTGQTATPATAWTAADTGSTLSTAGMDIITVINSDNDKLSLSAIASTLTIVKPVTNTIVDGTAFTSAGTGTSVQTWLGNYSSTTNLFTSNASGTDTLVVFDDNGSTVGGVLEALVLVGANTILTGANGSFTI